MLESPERSWQKGEVFRALKETSKLLIDASVFVPVIIAALYTFREINKIAQENNPSDILVGTGLVLGDFTVIVQNMISHAEIIINMVISEKDYS